MPHVGFPETARAGRRSDSLRGTGLGGGPGPASVPEVAVPAFAFLAELLVLALAVAIGYLLGRNAAVRGSVPV